MMHLVAIDDQVADRGFSIGAVHSDTKSIAAAPRRVAAWKVGLDVMNIILQELDMRSRASDADTHGSETVFGSAVIPDLEALDSDVALVVNQKHGASAAGSEMLTVQNGGLAWIASKSDVSGGCVAGNID